MSSSSSLTDEQKANMSDPSERHARDRERIMQYHRANYKGLGKDLDEGIIPRMMKSMGTWPGQGEAMERYDQLVKASEGFHLCEDALDHMDGLGRFEPVEKDTDYLGDAARFAVEKYNNSPLERKLGEQLEFKRIVRATKQELIYHLTLECTDGQFYEAKVAWFCWKPVKSIYFFLRPAKYYPAITCCT